MQPSSTGELASSLPRVSIVTPAFNAMPYLKENIESVLAQDYPNLEHIIMDGGSSDGSLELLRQYPHLTWRSEPDRGQSHALNKAFALASGEIIGWLNADDTYQPGAVDTAVAYLLAHPEADLVYSDLQIIDQQGQGIGYTRAQPFDLARQLLDNQVKQPTAFMRRAVLDHLQGVNEDYHYVMDRELWLRAGLRFRLVYLPGRVLANFRLIPGTKTYEHTPSFRREWLQVLERALRQSAFQDLPASVMRHALRHNWALYHLACMNQAIASKNRSQSLAALFKAIAADPRLVANRGLWRILAQAILGIPFDKLRKFRKVSHV
jgi:hypothetical protein